MNLLISILSVLISSCNFEV